MEENKVVAIEETNEVVKESKVKKIVGKVGTGIKNNWKTLAVGAGALAVGIVLGTRKSAPDETIETSEEEFENTDDTNEDL